MCDAVPPTTCACAAHHQIVSVESLGMAACLPCGLWVAIWALCPHLRGAGHGLNPACNTPLLLIFTGFPTASTLQTPCKALLKFSGPLLGSAMWGMWASSGFRVGF